MNFSATTAKAFDLEQVDVLKAESSLGKDLPRCRDRAFSISVGESPMVAMATTRARGFNPCALA